MAATARRFEPDERWVCLCGARVVGVPYCSATCEAQRPRDAARSDADEALRAAGDAAALHDQLRDERRACERVAEAHRRDVAVRDAELAALRGTIEIERAELTLLRGIYDAATDYLRRAIASGLAIARNDFEAVEPVTRMREGLTSSVAAYEAWTAARRKHEAAAKRGGRKVLP